MPDPFSILLPKRCVFCRKPHPDGLCGECREGLPWRDPPDKNGVVSPLLYREPVRSALHRYKFRGFSGYAEVFGLLMSQAVSGARVRADVVTWVPCSFLRKWTRGYDQSEKLARAVAKRLNLPAEKLLKKARHTKPQTKMPDGAARRENVRGAFRLLQNPPGRSILLIDDIHTTGATMEECRGILRSAGAGNVILCTAASRR
ncbi:MAG: ComF family protein [Oscillospiraceae bacterium]|jgi:ComF family protein|nr:ComF family protein [Oscillospiraceae bacterium]